MRLVFLSIILLVGSLISYVLILARPDNALSIIVVFMGFVVIPTILGLLHSYGKIDMDEGGLS